MDKTVFSGSWTSRTHQDKRKSLLCRLISLIVLNAKCSYSFNDVHCSVFYRCAKMRLMMEQWTMKMSNLLMKFDRPSCFWQISHISTSTCCIFLFTFILNLLNRDSCSCFSHSLDNDTETVILSYFENQSDFYKNNFLHQL